MPNPVAIAPRTRLHGSPVLSGDKSISHRALIFGALAKGTTSIENLLMSGDVRSTWKCLEALGVKISEKDGRVFVEGVGLYGFRAPKEDLDCGNSGTTMRLLMGLLAAQPFSAVLTGDESLCKRPMKRVAAPLVSMGAKIRLTRRQYAPAAITGAPARKKKLKSIDYELPVASAQLKSALLLAGLYTDAPTVLRGQIHSRDHTEKLLPYFGIPLQVSGNKISIAGGRSLRAVNLRVPGDPSSAAFWAAAAVLVKDGDVRIDNVLLNRTRTGFLDALARMGAKVQTTLTTEEPERVGSLEAKSSQLSAVQIDPKEIPSLIDEIPTLAVVATQAHGITEIRGAEELRVKESDRIEAIAENLHAMGAEIETFKDGFKIKGPQKLKGARLDSHGDHRIAMAFSIAALIAQGESQIVGAECVNISYPGFFETLDKLTLG